MNSKQIRQIFLDFFAQKQHLIVPSAPLVVQNDPTLMFTNAGMNQFKDAFLGNLQPSSPRIANTQKCLRVSGKHNDLEEVGIDTYHHTMFEMLGNWSFGDYFKEEAIAWAWELLTEKFDLPKERLYVTIFGGDQQDNLPQDQEAAEIWGKFVSKDRIIACSKKDNFWEMGDTGPCGPCSEIHIDLRSPEEITQVAGKNLVNKDHPQVIEIWNLVFMQFNRKADGSLHPLPAQHVDTGMGFERLAMAIQGKKSNYDTDVFQPLIQFIATLAGKPYGTNEKTDIAMRVVADHIRAIAFTIADGQLPSNNKAGYVIRRILRRALRYGYTFLDQKTPFLYSLVAVLVEQMGDFFPEIKAQQSFIEKVILEEENSFLRTLDKGLRRIEALTATNKHISGEQVFELYDTFGFPTDLTALIGRENGYTVDMEGFAQAMAAQKERSRADATSAKSDWQEVQKGQEVTFVGYKHTSCQTNLLRYRAVSEKNKTTYQLVLEQTPFYPEGGGQVGDKGTLTFEDTNANKEVINVFQTVRENELIIHLTDKLPTALNGTVFCQIDQNKRAATQANHSATHLLHAALKQVLGNHVAQKGSLVNDQVLRFDFSHFSKMTDQEIEQVEHLVNQKISANIALDEKINVPIQDALSLGATALFGEKYGDFVRVITFDPSYSVELCGGTHVQNTSQIGFFKIIAESSVAAGVRRIEALTSTQAMLHINQQLNTWQKAKDLLKNPKDPLKMITEMLEQQAELNKKIEAYQQKEVQQVFQTLTSQFVEDQSPITHLVAQINLPNAEAVRQLAFMLKQHYQALFGVLGAIVEGKPHLAVILSDTVAQTHDASQIVRTLAKEIQGGGGGQRFFATAGGKKPEGLNTALAQAKAITL